jgi:hypothetical protein
MSQWKFRYQADCWGFGDVTSITGLVCRTFAGMPLEMGEACSDRFEPLDGNLFDRRVLS